MGTISSFATASAYTDFLYYLESESRSPLKQMAACSLKLRILSKWAVQKLRTNMNTTLILPTLPAEVVDERKLSNLLNRRAVYGVICQSFEEDEIRSYMQCYSCVPAVIGLMIRSIKKGERSRKFLAPYVTSSFVNVKRNLLSTSFPKKGGRKKSHKFTYLVSLRFFLVMIFYAFILNQYNSLCKNILYLIFGADASPYPVSRQDLAFRSAMHTQIIF
jgi:hypothetical protein